jgi:hypothetical protein
LIDYEKELIESFIVEYNEVMLSFKEKAQNKLKEVFNEFWEENPDVKIVTWTQYAPYFNDGDPCEFSVGDLTFSNATEEDDVRELYSGYYDGETEGIWAFSTWNADTMIQENSLSGVNLESIKMLSTFINSEAMEQALKASLGEDNIIFATREGIRSDDYSGSHD